MKFIIFMKNLDHDKEVWNKSSVINFLLQQKLEYFDITEEVLCFVVRTIKIDNPDDYYRLVELTPTISIIVRDDPSLDGFLEIENNDETKEDIF